MEEDYVEDRQEDRVGEEGNLGIEKVWDGIVMMQGKTLYTKSGLPFAYCVKDKSIFIDRKKKTITKSTIEKALGKLREQGEKIGGPKALGMFGAPYIWALFSHLELVDKKREKRQEDSSEGIGGNSL